MTCDQVTPESVDRHSPLPLGAPRYSTLFRFGSIASRSPMPRPGMLPPSLNGRFAFCQLAPRFEDRMTAPFFGSQLLVYVPTAAYTRFGSTESDAMLTTPVCPQSSHPTESSNGVQVLDDSCQRYAPPMSVRA